MGAQRERVRSQMGKLADRINKHSGGGRGMSNALVARLARACGAGEDFLGVFPADCLPRKETHRKSFRLVVNLGTWKDTFEKRVAVGHFVAVVAGPDSVTYADSYGLPCVQPHVLRFLEECGRKRIVYNSRPVQSLSSRACGLYAMLAVLYIGRHRFGLKFGKRDLAANDARCVENLRKIIELNYKRGS